MTYSECASPSITSGVIDLPDQRPAGTRIEKTIFEGPGAATSPLEIEGAVAALGWIKKVSGEFAPLFQHLKRIEAGAENWLRFETVCPNKASLDSAFNLLNRLQSNNLCPTRIIPSAEGGIGFLFGTVGSRYADLECSNSEEITALTSDGKGDVRVWTVPGTFEDITNTINTLKSFLNPQG